MKIINKISIILYSILAIVSLIISILCLIVTTPDFIVVYPNYAHFNILLMPFEIAVEFLLLYAIQKTKIKMKVILQTLSSLILSVFYISFLRELCLTYEGVVKTMSMILIVSIIIVWTYSFIITIIKRQNPKIIMN